MQIGLFITERTKPEQGLSYEEVAAILWGDDDYMKTHTGAEFDDNFIQAEYRKDYRSKIDRLL